MMTTPFWKARRFAAGLSCLALLLLPGCNEKPTAQAPLPPEGLIELAESDLVSVSPGEIELTLHANGTLHARHESLIRAKVAGEVVAVALREGERVEAGQELAHVDDLEYRARVDDRRAALEAGRAQARLAETTRSKNEELRQKNFLSNLAYDSAKSTATVTQSQVQSLEAQLALAEKGLQDTLIRAPISGWVAERFIQRGDKVSPDARLFSIVDLSHLELEALIPAQEISRVSIGQPFKAHVEGFSGRTYHGRVARIGAQALTGSRAMAIYIDIDNPDAALKSGLFAEGTLIMGHAQAQALVPLTALHSETGNDFVYGLVNNQIRRLPVKVGMRSEAEGRAEILQSLEPGTRIVALNLGPLKEGATVRISATPPSPAATVVTPTEH
ncbi:MAG: efflux RND transporter periplasmic adaptor subunit [Sterolibacterium sp.]|nr:efflux RND transporter periplasmic adaptor subunit [Sterolibacterium sp.]